MQSRQERTQIEKWIANGVLNRDCVGTRSKVRIYTFNLIYAYERASYDNEDQTRTRF